MLSIQKKFLFIHVPKTGGNSIQNILKEHSEDDIVVTGKHQDGVERFEVRNKQFNIKKHSTLSHYKSVLPTDLYRPMFKFATIRNPWDMMISFYFSPHRSTTEFKRDDFLGLVKKTPTLRHYICTQTPWQKTIVKFRGNALKGGKKIDGNIDFLIKFEQIESDFKQVCDRLGIPSTSLPKRNSSERVHYSHYYDDELKELVRTKFSEEIEYGKYAFETS